MRSWIVVSALASLCALASDVSAEAVAAASDQSPAHASGQTPSVADLIRAAEEQWLKALYEIDSSSLQHLESSDFTMVSPAARIGRDQMLGNLNVKRRPAPEAAADSTPPYAVSNQMIRVYGDVAVVSEVCVVTGSAKSAQLSPGRFWITNVWHREATAWKLAYTHLSPFEHGM